MWVLRGVSGGVWVPAELKSGVQQNVLLPPGAGLKEEPGGAPFTVQEVIGSPSGSDEFTSKQMVCPSLTTTLDGAVTTGGWSALAIRGRTAQRQAKTTARHRKQADLGRYMGKLHSRSRETARRQGERVSGKELKGSRTSRKGASEESPRKISGHEQLDRHHSTNEGPFQGCRRFGSASRGTTAASRRADSRLCRAGS